MKYKMKRVISIELLLIDAILIMDIVPYLTRNVPRLIQISLSAIWLLYVLTTNRLAKAKRWKLALVFGCLFIMYEVLYKLMGVSSAEWGNYFSDFRYLLICPISLTISEVFDTAKKKHIMWVILLSFLYSIISNISISNTVNYYISYYATETGYNTNAASTIFGTACVIILGACVILTINKNTVSRRDRVIFAVFASITAYYIVSIAQRATNVLLVVAMLYGLIFFRKKRSGQSITLFVAFTLIVMICVYLFSDQILMFIMNSVKSERLASKFKLLYQFLNNDDTITRLELMKVSIQTFFGSIINFFFGIGYHKFESIANAYQIGIGGHADFIDVLPKYGVVGSMLLYAYLFQMIGRIKDTEAYKKYHHQMNIVIAAFIFRSFFGKTINADVAIAFFVLLPHLECLCHTKQIVVTNDQDGVR